MFKKSIFILAIVAVLSFGLSFFVFSEKVAKPEDKDEIYRKLELFSDALVIVHEEYVDEPKINDLVNGALQGMLSSLDSYSEYLDPEKYLDLKTDTEGKFGGLGIEIAIKDGVLTVITPIEDTPAWDAGVKAGDRIVKINGGLTKNISIGDAVKQLRGETGTEVNITVLREGALKLLEFKIVRAIIKIKDIKDPLILEDNIGYLRLVEFRENTSVDLSQTLTELKDKGMDSLILDLRNNPGGLLDVAVKVADKFLPADKMIVYTKGRIESQNMEFKSQGADGYTDIPMVVLVNEGSASGSEIVAGALQDYKRAVLVGQKTFGKGLVQSVLPLADGSAVKITTSRYYTPLGRMINDKGIMPDIEVSAEKIEIAPAPGNTADDIFTKVEGKEEPVDIPKKNFLDTYKSDNQLVHAIEAIKAIKVYKAMRF